MRNHVGSGVGGFVEVWWAYNPTPQSNITVTGSDRPSKNVTPSVGALQVIVLTNAAADQTPAAWTPRWDVDPTLPAGQTTTINGRAAVVPNPTDLDTYWVQSQRAPTAAVGPITINATAPSVRDHMIAWEVRAP